MTCFSYFLGAAFDGFPMGFCVIAGFWGRFDGFLMCFFEFSFLVFLGWFWVSYGVLKVFKGSLGLVLWLLWFVRLKRNNTWWNLQFLFFRGGWFQWASTFLPDQVCERVLRGGFLRFFF